MKISITKNFFIYASLIFILSCLITEPNIAEPEKVKPAELYKYVYKRISWDYYDSSFNGQDWNKWLLGNAYKEEEIVTFEDAYKAIEIMLGSLDDSKTRLIRKDSSEIVSSEFCGIGLKIKLNEAKEAIVTPAADYPVDAGIKNGDKLLKIDNQLVKGLSLQEISNKLQGKKGSEATLEIERNNEIKEFHISRIPDEEMTFNHFSGELNDKVYYIRLERFFYKCEESFLKQLNKASKYKTVILDLRDNKGGLLDTMTNIANFLLPPKTLLFSLKSNRKNTQTREIFTKETDHAFQFKGKIIVLINPETASGAEALAASLQDNKRAILVGETSQRYGLIQLLSDLPDGSLIMLSSLELERLNGQAINKNGVEPNYFVNLNKADLENEKGPWFYYKTQFSEISQISKIKDLQLLKAIELSQ